MILLYSLMRMMMPFSFSFEPFSEKKEEMKGTNYSLNISHANICGVVSNY